MRVPSRSLRPLPLIQEQLNSANPELIFVDPPGKRILNKGIELVAHNIVRYGF